MKDALRVGDDVKYFLNKHICKSTITKIAVQNIPHGIIANKETLATDYCYSKQIYKSSVNLKEIPIEWVDSEISKFIWLETRPHWLSLDQVITEEKGLKETWKDAMTIVMSRVLNNIDENKEGTFKTSDLFCEYMDLTPEEVIKKYSD